MILSHMQLLGHVQLGEDHQMHPVGAIVIFVQLLHGLHVLDPLLLGNQLQTFQVPGVELVHRGPRLCQRSQQGPGLAKLIGDVLEMLAVHSVHLPICRRRREQRGDEKLGKPIQPLVQGIRGDLVEIHRLLLGSEGVVLPVVLIQEIVVVRLVRVLLRAQEEHVLHEVGEARELLGVVERAGLNCHGKTALGGGRVLDGEHLQPIGEGGVFIGARIALRLPQHHVLFSPHYTTTSGQAQRCGNRRQPANCAHVRKSGAKTVGMRGPVGGPQAAGKPGGATQR
mmetsp:Transcript_38063/g.91331  ORF Transcript_38063/g.91331 Transcript_38063/m.91331 type:complete len:282 (+) Transcript_38063:2248-3093(+)